MSKKKKRDKEVDTESDKVPLDIEKALVTVVKEMDKKKDKTS